MDYSCSSTPWPWNGSPEDHEPGRRTTMDWFAMSYLSSKIREVSESFSTDDELDDRSEMADERTDDEIDDMRNQEQSMEEQVTTKHEPDADILIDLEKYMPSDIYHSEDAIVMVPTPHQRPRRDATDQPNHLRRQRGNDASMA